VFPQAGKNPLSIGKRSTSVQVDAKDVETSTGQSLTSSRTKSTGSTENESPIPPGRR
jgi:hypothetical protein